MRQPRRGNAAEFFFQLPLRLVDALKRGDLSATGFQIVTFLAAECWRNEGAAIYGVAELQAVLDYHKSRDTFLRELKAVRTEWIEFDLQARQRKAVEVTLTGAAVRQTGTTGAYEGAGLRQTTDAARQSSGADGPLAEPISATLRLAHSGSREVTRGEERRPEQTRSDAGCADCDGEAEVEYGSLVLCRRCAATRKRTAASLRRRTLDDAGR